MLFNGQDFQRSRGDTSVSPSFNSRWTHFREMFWSTAQTSPHLSFKVAWGQECASVQLWVMLCTNRCWQYSAESPGVKLQLSNGWGATCWPEQGCSPLHPHGFAPKPLPQYFYHPYFGWSWQGAASSSLGGRTLQHAGVGLWCGYDLETHLPAHLTDVLGLPAVWELRGLAPSPLHVQGWGSTASN